jgi:soluble lytic murein transglycosylase
MSKRLFRVYRAAGLALAAAALVACSTASAVKPVPLSQLSNDDQIFVQLREAARNNDPARAAQLAAMIPDYPAPGYVEYFQLKPQLFDSSGHPQVDTPDAPVLSFLQKYDGQAIADRLRNDYLVVLGARHDWNNFDQQYARFVLNDDTQVKCYALESRAARGENVADAAHALLVEPKWYGDGCVDLITALALKQQFSADDVWQQIRLAYEQNYTNVGSKLVDALGNQRPDPVLFDQAASTPPLLLARGVGPDSQSHQLALLAITRMARNDPAMAAATFASVAPSLSSPERAIGWGTIAYQAAAIAGSLRAMRVIASKAS